jgi:cytochrome P450
MDRGGESVTEQALLAQIFDHANRHNPYPLYARQRETPVARQPDGTYVVSGYREIVALLHDPRMSSDPSNRKDHGPAPGPPRFITTDPPDHDRLRRQANRHFGPPNKPGLVAGLEPQIQEIVMRLIDDLRGRQRVDLVEDVAYPLPVAVICRLLGVPEEDEPRFHVWADGMVNALGARFQEEGREELMRAGAEAFTGMSEYLGGLIERHRENPAADWFSGMINDDGPDGRMDEEHLLGNAVLMFLAGHETTVNLIANGILTLLRDPGMLERVREQPDTIIPLVEELLRFEPPVQMLPWRTALGDITVGDTTIPAGSPVLLLLAAGSRDPARFEDPERFDPGREDNQHLGFGGGIHYCFGAPLARLEVQLALRELVRRLENPRLLDDPPPYRPSPLLRGPLHLPVEIDGVRD